MSDAKVDLNRCSLSRYTLANAGALPANGCTTCRKVRTAPAEAKPRQPAAHGRGMDEHPQLDGDFPGQHLRGPAAAQVAEDPGTLAQQPAQALGDRRGQGPRCAPGGSGLQSPLPFGLEASPPAVDGGARRAEVTGCGLRATSLTASPSASCRMASARRAWSLSRVLCTTRMSRRRAARASEGILGSIGRPLPSHCLVGTFNDHGMSPEFR